jgi:hypothetical protein
MPRNVFRVVFERATILDASAQRREETKGLRSAADGGGVCRVRGKARRSVHLYSL